MLTLHSIRHQCDSGRPQFLIKKHYGVVRIILHPNIYGDHQN